MDTHPGMDPAQDQFAAFEPAVGETAANPMKSTFGGAPRAGYCLWEFDGAQWLLKSNRSQPGYVPSPPPCSPGRFRGQLRAVMCVPSKGPAE